MLDITAANTRNLPTVAKPSGPKTYTKKADAQAAAVADLGPMARDGFEFTTDKCDGRWLWRTTDPDKVPPDTAAEIKTNGGKRHITAIAASLMAQNSPGEPTHASKPNGAVLQPSTPESSPAKPPVAWATIGDMVADAIDAGVTPGQVAADLAGLGVDPFAIPTFLQRQNTTTGVKRSQARTKAPYGVVIGETVAPAPKAKLSEPLPAKTKSQIVADMIRRAGGCTAAEAMAAVGWTKISMPAHAKVNGIKLVTKKDGSVSRYFAG